MAGVDIFGFVENDLVHSLISWDMIRLFMISNRSSSVIGSGLFDIILSTSTDRLWFSFI